MYVKKYSRLQVLLHWISAVVIIWATLSGFFVAMVKVSPSTKAFIGFINVSLTTVFIPFFILRVYCLVRNNRGIHEKRNLSEHIAKIVHMILYVNIAVVLTTGVLMMDRDIHVFNIIAIPQPLTDPTVTQLFFYAHIIACFTLAGLVFLHILAVIKHEIVGNPVLRRMCW